ncbi:MAG: aminotransferase class I/II-fold pyridoxal phosphate-dependent enzyme [Candidatus Omnitrophica bacterium]|nr:aminotransferase class I/II-fold pyridoxal phosphate-dependent enzyme [Candidatus Omnitrophota bacterium]
MPKDFLNNVVSEKATLKDVLDRLNQGALGAVFFVGTDKRMVGVMTDGDVRRAFLKDATLDMPATRFLRQKFTSGRANASHEENVRLLTDEIRHLPILDAKGRLVDVLSWAEMWRMPIMEPVLAGNEMKYVMDCIATNWISSQGPYVKSFEVAFAKYHDMSYATATCNGTAALHLALTALGVGPGDEVIVPNLTFAASANAVIHSGAKPILVDVTKNYWNMDPAKLESVLTPRTKVIMPVHLYGHPCDMDPIMALAEKRKLFVVEDCAEALGAEYKGKKVGTFGDAACFSFFSNKVITTGEGGMVTCADASLYDKMMVLRDHGMRRGRRYWHEVAGFNYRMTNLQAAIGLAQLEQIDRFLASRRKIAQHYTAGFKGLPGITLPPEMPWAKNIYWLYSILIDEKKTGITRDELVRGLEREGIETRTFFYPLHHQPPYRSSDPFPVTEALSARGISLPSSNGIKPGAIERVCKDIHEKIEHHRVMNRALKATVK